MEGVEEGWQVGKFLFVLAFLWSKETDPRWTVYRKGIRHSSRGNTGAAEGPYSPQQGDGIDEEPLVSRSDQIPAEMCKLTLSLYAAADLLITDLHCDSNTIDDITDAEAGPSSPHQGSDIAYVSRRGPMLCALGCDLDTIDTSKIPLYLLVRLLTRYAHPPLRSTCWSLSPLPCMPYWQSINTWFIVDGNELGKAILYARIQKSWSRAELARPINERECDFAEYEHNKTLLNPTVRDISRFRISSVLLTILYFIEQIVKKMEWKLSVKLPVPPKNGSLVLLFSQILDYFLINERSDFSNLHYMLVHEFLCCLGWCSALDKLFFVEHKDVYLFLVVWSR